MKWPLFENKIRKTLRNHRSEVDVDAIWAAIEPQVDAMNQRKKRRVMLFWFILPTLLLSGAAFYAFHQNRWQVNELGSPVISPVFKVEDSKDAQASILTAQSSMPLAKDEYRDKASNTDSLLENERGRRKADNPIAEQTAIKKASSNEGTLQRAVASSSIIASGSSTGASTNPLETIAEQQQTIAAPLLAADKLPCPTLMPFKIAGDANLDVKTKELLEMLPLRKRDWQLTGAIQGSISFLDRKMSAKDAASLELLDLRERHERQLEAVQAGIRIGVEHRSGLSLHTGLNYAQLNELYKNNSTVTSIDTVYGVQYYYVNLDDDTVAIYGDIPLESKTTYRKQFYNKYRLFEVPVLVGWRHEGHQFSFGAQAGVFVNVRMTTKGRVLESASGDMDMAKSGIFRNNVGLSYYLGLTAGFMLSEQLEVYASPFVRHFPKSFAKANYGLEQRYNLYGLNVGVGYRF